MVKKPGHKESGDAQGNFAVDKGVLRAWGDMYWECLEEFDNACKKLLKSRRTRVVLDLTAVNFISSSFLGCLTNTLMLASRLGKRMSIKVTLDISWLFDIMGAQKNIDIELC